MALLRLQIEGEGGVPTDGSYHVWLDDYEITKATRSLSLNMDVGEANTATFTVFVSQLELSADVEAKLIPAKGKERTSFASRFREWLDR